MGQNTGTSKNWKNVKNIDSNVDFITEYQNLNSGSRRINGLNSSFARVGNDGPESSSNSSIAGSIFGVRNAINKFKWYIPSAYVIMYHPCNIIILIINKRMNTSAPIHLAVRNGVMSSRNF